VRVYASYHPPAKAPQTNSGGLEPNALDTASPTACRALNRNRLGNRLRTPPPVPAHGKRQAYRHRPILGSPREGPAAPVGLLADLGNGGAPSPVGTSLGHLMRWTSALESSSIESSLYRG